MSNDRKRPNETWADYLFRKVEAAQGAAYISDGIPPGSRVRVMEIARAAKRAHNEAVCLLNDFLIEADQHPQRLRKRRAKKKSQMSGCTNHGESNAPPVVGTDRS